MIESVIMFVSLGLIIFSSTWVGSVVTRLLLPESAVILHIGLGVIIGGSALALLSLLFPSLGINSAFSPIVLLVAALFLQVKFRTKFTFPPFPEVTSVERKMIYRAGAVGILGVNGHSLPLTAVGLLMLLLPSMGLLKLRHPARRKQVTFAVTTLAITAFILTARLQPSWSHSLSNDTPFFEALSIMLPRFGVSAHPGHIDVGVRGYHVLTYAWSGTLTELTGAPPFVMLSLVVPFLAATSLTMLLLSVAISYQKVSELQFILVAVYVWILASGSFASAAFGNWSIIAYVVAHIFTERYMPGIVDRGAIARREALLGILGAIAVLGKGSTLPLICLVGIAPTVHHILCNRLRNRSTLIRNTPVHLAAVIAVTFAWFPPGTRLRSLESQSPIKSVITLGPNEGLWAVRDLLEFGPILGIMSVVAVLLWIRSADNTSLTYSLTLIVTLCLGSLLSVWFFSERQVRSNVAQHAFFVCLALFVTLSMQLAQHRSTSSELLRLIAVSAPLLGIVSVYDRYYLKETLWDRQWPARWIAPVLENSRLPMLLLIILIISYGLRVGLSRREKENHPEKYHTLLMTLVVFVVGVWVSTLVNRIEETHNLIDSSNHVPAAPWNASVPDSETKEVGAWIRGHTPKAAVLASNSFCCWDNPDFLETALDELRKFDHWWTRYGESTFGGSNYLLPAVTHRRFLLAGPRFVVGAHENPGELTEYLALSVRYGVTGDPNLAAALRRAGVSYFIFNKRVATVPTLITRTPPQFENSQFLVIRL